MRKKILITGITGFVGSHLADYALNKNVEVYGLKRWHLSKLRNISHILDKIKLVDADLTDPIGIEKVIKKIKPDWIFHLAAMSFVSPSWDHPTHYMNVNYNGTVNLLEAIRAAKLPTRILLAGSAEEYGEVSKEDIPIVEKTFLQPVNPYAVSKIAQDLIGFVYYKSYGVNVIRTRAFNHEGPRRDNVFGISWYAYQVARIEKGLQKPIIRTGLRDDRRTFMHVVDLVKAYWLAIEKCKPGKLYLIGADEKNHVYTFDEALELLIKMSTYKGKISKVIDKEFVRPTSVPRLIANSKEFRKLTNWKPKIPFETILEDTLNYWREFIEKKMY
ncbi:MAG: GDP-mannose 4,6-dehydratase [Candidatus Levybacteria bacterium]|nr:GDP-mannose 4,6-dehydratase [Candidatus Levybacteria bacterium]